MTRGRKILVTRGNLTFEICLFAWENDHVFRRRNEEITVLVQDLCERDVGDHWMAQHQCLRIVQVFGDMSNSLVKELDIGGLRGQQIISKSVNPENAFDTFTR